jgi:PhzF family phenazine biosynthesis protein
MKRPFCLVDVFTSGPLNGNPLAVVFGADDLSDVQMQAFARWMNLSETTFLLRPTLPEADYRMRIFTPGGELPFAGHPTLGTCHAWLEAGGKPKRSDLILQECGVGLVRIRPSEDHLAFAAPPLESRAVEEDLLSAILNALRLDPSMVKTSRWLDNGSQWVGLLLSEVDVLLNLEPDHAALKQLVKVGVIAPITSGGPCAFEVRAFAASTGVPEDPVTGSLNAALAQWLIGEGLAPECYVVSQGTCLHRAGRIHVERKNNDVWIGGHTITCIKGELQPLSGIKGQKVI